MTLLEVLVALGILVAGLASVASLMPAAGTRLADATAIDRAGTLSANAHADLRNRMLLTAKTLFPDKTSKIAILGQLASIDQAPTEFASPPCVTYPGLLPVSVCITQDDLQLGSANTLVTNTTGVCYGATVIPTGTAGAVEGGSLARVAVIVFKKQPVESRKVNLIKLSGGVFQITGTTTTGTVTTGPQPEANRKKFFPACSWVFVTGTANKPNQAQWLHVGSSWTTQTIDAQGRLIPDVSSVSFSNAEAGLVGDVVVSGTLPVYAFTRVLRVDEQPAVLK